MSKSATAPSVESSAFLSRPIALKYRTPWDPWTALAGIFLQVACLVFCAFSPDLRVAFSFGVPALLVPMTAYWTLRKMGKIRRPDDDRVRFDDLFPARPGSPVTTQREGADFMPVPQLGEVE